MLGTLVRFLVGRRPSGSMGRFLLVQLARLLVGAALLLLWNEFLVYYVVLLRCGWPRLQTDGAPIRAMLLADTHMLGSRAHWFDKLRREWQMHRSFQTAMTLFSPSTVFFLGDLFDEGKWSNDREFTETLNRFRKMFKTPEKTRIYAAVGNHDVGFHYDITPHKLRRFDTSLSTSVVQLVTVRDVHFVLVNSMAFEGDECSLCNRAQTQLLNVRTKLECWRNPNSSITCPTVKQQGYSRPILLQHFPLYRVNDANCSGADSAPPGEKYETMRQRWECLSKDATHQLLGWVQPRLVIDGHTHHWCHVHLGSGIEELTLPSFSWRNKRNPSFLLLSANSREYAWSKCYMPDEDTVINVYCGGLLSMLLLLALQPWIGFCQRFRHRSQKVQ